MKQTKPKLLSGVLAAALLLQIAMPATVFASEPAAKTIVGFSTLEQTEYTLPMGADETATQELLAAFPEIITAEVEYIVTEEAVDSSAEEPEPSDDEEALPDTSLTEKVVSEEVELAVTWGSDKPLTTEAAMEFTYTAVLSDTDKGRYDFASDVSLPELTVAVEAPLAMMMSPRAEETAATVTKNGVTTDYATLRDAIDAVAEGETIVLQKDLTETVNIGNSSPSFTLDLNGKTLAPKNVGNTITYEGAGKLTICDSGTGGKVTGTDDYYAISAKSGVINISGGTVTSNRTAIFALSGSIHISGGTIEGKEYRGIEFLEGVTVNVAVANDGEPAIIKGASFVMDTAPTLGADTVGWASKYISGTPLVPYNANKITSYKYLKFENSENSVSIGNAHYNSLQEAIDAVADGETIVLQKDLAESVTIGAGRPSFTLDLNGKTLSESGNNTITHNGTGALTISDSGTGGTVKNTNNLHYTIFNQRGSTVNITGGTVTSNNWTIFSSGGVINISGGTVAGDMCGITSLNGVLNISGGTVTSSGTGWIRGAAIQSSGVINISGGTVASEMNGIASDAGNIINISIPKAGAPAVIKGMREAMNFTPTLSADTVVQASENISGTPLVPYNGNNIGSYKYLKFESRRSDVVSIGNAHYTTLQAAINAVADGETIVLQKDLTEAVTIGAGRPSFTLDLNGKTLSVSDSKQHTIIHKGTGALTITDGAVGGGGTVTSEHGLGIAGSKGAIINFDIANSGAHCVIKGQLGAMNIAPTLGTNTAVGQASENISGTPWVLYNSNVNERYKYLKFTYQTGGDSTDGDSGDSSDSNTTEAPNSPSKGNITVPPTISGNTATVTVSVSIVKNAISKAQTEAKQNGKTDNGISVEIKVDSKNAVNLKANLPKASIDALVTAGVKETKITSGVAIISLSLNTLKEIQKQAGGDVTVTAVKLANSTLSSEAKALVGNRPVYDFNITGKNGVKVTSFGKGTVSVAIPYTLGANEKAGNVIAYYIDSAGKTKELSNSAYDAETKALRFITNHFSVYAVGYKSKTAAFTDIANHPAKESIEFVTARGLLAGTGESKFSPDTAMTNSVLVSALGKMTAVNVSGIGSQFAANQAISREQMAVIMQNYAKAIGFDLPKVHAQNTFADNTKISSNAREAVKVMQMAGVLTGKNGNKFDPQGTATRAEVSAVLKRFVELTISTDSAQGWVLNDSGKWMFYENGRPVTGTKSISGARYTFNVSGETSDQPKNMTAIPAIAYGKSPIGVKIVETSTKY